MSDPRQPFIVAEVSKNWRAGVEVTPGSGLLSQQFERVINVNQARGYRLHSFQVHRTMGRGDDMNETIVAVFEAVTDDAARPAAPHKDAPARVGTRAGVGTKVGTKGKTR